MAASYGGSEDGPSSTALAKIEDETEFENQIDSAQVYQNPFK